MGIRAVKLEDINMLLKALKHSNRLFMKDFGSMNCTLEELLKLHDVKNPKAIQKFCLEKGVFRHDPEKSSPRNSWIYYAYPKAPTQRMAENIIIGAKNATRGTPLGDDWNDIKKKTVEDVIEENNNVIEAMNTETIEVAEERMNIVGQNGNDGEHYNEENFTPLMDMKGFQPDSKKEMLVEMFSEANEDEANLYDEIQDLEDKLAYAKKKYEEMNTIKLYIKNKLEIHGNNR